MRPFRDDVRAVGHAQRFAHVVVGDEDADAAGLEDRDDLLQLDARAMEDRCQLVEPLSSRIKLGWRCTDIARFQHGGAPRRKERSRG